MCDISIIIPTYNRAQYIEKTLTSFVNQKTNKSYEIIVCDNHSTDNTKSVIERFIQENSGCVITYMYEERQGVHYARNSAAQIAKGKYLYFTDDDMLAEPECIDKLVSVFEFDSKIGIATGKVYPIWEKEPPKWVKKYLNNYLLSLIDLNAKYLITEHDCGVYSCHEMIKKELFFKTNGFHPENTAGNWIGDGETGLNKEIIDMGFFSAYVGDSVIGHMIPTKRMTQAYINTRMYNQGCSDCYTEIREKSGKGIDVKMSSYLFEFIIKCMKILVNTVIGRSTVRFIPANYCYFKAKRDYTKKYLEDDAFRQMVLKDDWNS